MKFRTPYTNNLKVEKCCAKSEDFVPNATPSLSELIDKFNRGQRLTGVNYGINPNFMPSGIDDGDKKDDFLPSDVIPHRISDIVEAEEAKAYAEEVKRGIGKKKEKKQPVSEQAPS